MWFGHRALFSRRAVPLRLEYLRQMLLSRLRTNPSTLVETVHWLFRKNPYQPLSVGLSRKMTSRRERPGLRGVFCRMRSRID